jgi:formate-dependent nitrite reductase membrane component NrfD
LTKSFFESLGFVFGDNVDAPWVFTAELPALYIENALSSGVADATVASPVSFNGKTVVAEGSNVAVFNLTGVKVAENANTLSLTNLSAGVYVVVVTDANGHSSAFKAAIK